jgi:N-acetylmuramoyl-L-alanine amidase
MTPPGCGAALRRIRARFGRPLLAAALLAAGSLAAAEPAPVRAPPTRPAAVRWETVRLRGADFVDLRQVGERLGWTASYDPARGVLTLADRGGRTAVFEHDQRDCHIDGARVFLAEQVASHRESLWVAQTDLTKTVGPLLRPADHVAALPLAPRLVVLDPGHGGTDPGKHNPRLKLNEKDMTLDLALRLQRLLEARGYRVKLTRRDDTRFSNNPVVDLQRRAAFSNEQLADLFVSLHFNAVDPREAQRVSGTETFVLTPQGQLSTVDGSRDDLTGVAFPGNRNDIANVILGFHLHRQLVQDLGTSDRGYKRARFAVLRFVDAPAVLVEAAYLSNDEEAARVARPEYRQRIAESLARGIDAYARQLATLRPEPPRDR